MSPKQDPNRLIALPDRHGHLHHVPAHAIKPRVGAYGTLIGYAGNARFALVIANEYHGKYGLVGGGLDDYGELAPEAAVREALEESGLAVRVLRQSCFHERLEYYMPGGDEPDEPWRCFALCYMIELVSQRGSMPTPTAADLAEGRPMWVPLQDITRENCFGACYDAHLSDPRASQLKWG